MSERESVTITWSWEISPADDGYAVTERSSGRDGYTSWGCPTESDALALVAERKAAITGLTANYIYSYMHRTFTPIAEER